MIENTDREISDGKKFNSEKMLRCSVTFKKFNYDNSFTETEANGEQSNNKKSDNEPRQRKV